VKRIILVLTAALLLPDSLLSQSPSVELQAEIAKIDAHAADPAQKFAVAWAIADHLKIHRNHLALLSRQSGQTYGQIFRSTLEQAGETPEGILHQARELNAQIERSFPTTREQPETASSLQPVMYITTTVDHNSVGTFYSAVPQLGIESRNAVLTLALPFYRIAGAGSTSGGTGDMQANAYLYTQLGNFHIGGGILAGFPTGNDSLGLSAGKVTVDGTVQLSWQPGKARVFVIPGFANSVFNNVVYQRPYISDGNAAHVTAGAEVQAHRRLVIGVGGFALRPTGSQLVISRTSVEPSPASQPAQPQPPRGPPPGRGRGVGPKVRAPGEPPVFEQGTTAEVSAADLRDHGVSGWSYVRLHPSVSLQFAVARSVPFRLTTARVGLAFNVARLLSLSRH